MAKNIYQIFRIYTELKDNIRQDRNRLAAARNLVLGRLEFGVFRLVEGSL